MKTHLKIIAGALLMLSSIAIYKLVKQQDEPKVFAQYNSSAAVFTIWQKGTEWSIATTYKDNNAVEYSKAFYQPMGYIGETPYLILFHYSFHSKSCIMAVPMCGDAIMVPMIKVNDTLGIKLTPLKYPQDYNISCPIATSIDSNLVHYKSPQQQKGFVVTDSLLKGYQFTLH